MTHKASFDIKTSKDFFERIVLPQHAEFVADNSSSRHALLCAIVAYHMFDWVHRDDFKLERFGAKYPGQDDAAEMFEIARRLVNGTKHFKNRIETHTQTGFSSDFSDDWARPLNVIKDDGSVLSADSLLGALVAFWEGERAKGKLP